jgi:hypothetical protein
VKSIPPKSATASASPSLFVLWSIIYPLLAASLASACAPLASQSRATAAVQDWSTEPIERPVKGSKYFPNSPSASCISDSRRRCSALCASAVRSSDHVRSQFTTGRSLRLPEPRPALPRMKYGHQARAFGVASGHQVPMPRAVGKKVGPLFAKRAFGFQRSALSFLAESRRLIAYGSPWRYGPSIMHGAVVERP